MSSTDGVVRYEPASVRGGLERTAPILVAAAATLVLNEATDVLGGDAFLSYIAAAFLAVGLGGVPLAFLMRGKLSLALGPDALRAGTMVVPWAGVVRAELSRTKAHPDAPDGGPGLDWLMLAVEPGTELQPSMSQRRIARMLTDWADVGVSVADLPVSPEELLADVRARVASARREA